MQEEVHGIKVDYTRDSLFDILGMKRLRESYMTDEEQSPQERYAFVSKTFGTDEAHAQRLYEYASKHWLSYSTPILSFGRSKKGLPISCYLNYVEDSASGLVENFSETSWLSMMGGGVGIGFGIRSADDKSTGVMSHMKMYDASSLAYRQGKTRRGSYASYLRVDHPDILTFLEMRKPTGDQNIRCLNMHHGVNIPDAFMDIIEKCMIDPEADDTWNLIDPHSKEVRETVSAKELWQSILEIRMQTGEPYILWGDSANKTLPDYLIERGYDIKQSNLCSEILLHTDFKKTAVCCLSSLNLEYWDEWKNDKQFIADVMEMLDNVLEYFIENAPNTIKRARDSAKWERSVGLGVLGWHSLLQQKNIPFESPIAKSLNMNVFKHIRENVDNANMALGEKRGSPELLKGTGRRFNMTMAIAPTASSSIIMGNTSPSIEPMRANAYRQETLSGSYMNKNKYLDKILREKLENDEEKLAETWSSIISNDGSVQHLDILDDYTKEVFKTANEIDQRWVIEHAADRQPFIDQTQSLNLFFKPDVNIKYLHAVHFSAWKQGVKTLYYCRSDKIRKADKVSKRIERERIESIDLQALVNGEETCLACGS